tara:strand:- start:3594 stop:4010 length:417 start_codon:yes stop_codon:yes gene_type:complete
MKVLPDDTELYGPEDLELKGKASWRKTPCYLKECILQDGDLAVRIKGEGEYWQSDRYEVPVSPGEQIPVKVKRRLMRQIRPGETQVVVARTSDGKTLGANFGGGIMAPVYPCVPGHWLVLEIDRRTQQMTHYFSEEKI